MFKELRDQGEKTPLDIIPEVNDYIELWFFNCYKNLINLTGFEHHLSITDFYHYFLIYPIPFSKPTVISVIKKIESKVLKHKEKIDEAKANINGLPN